MLSAPMKPLNLYLVSIHKRPRPQSVQPTHLAYQGVGEQSYLSVELAWDPPEGLRTSQQVTYQVYAQLIGPEDLINELSTQPGMDAAAAGLLTSGDPYPGANMLLPAPLRRRLLANVTGNTFRSSESDNIGKQC
ncbi:Receptor-type tyrosine-protein phosphatase delta [Fasciola gigantica]|uniref:Receptor-type tyrosine-protein phosphatase delta n=1 Tax=Fasciola gigantica TaxID=46835 RepID=A0A504Z724_FASGI|nr:Receptor-type tyrosine-protein phosphatase delta [Fasciola gigantica]